MSSQWVRLEREGDRFFGFLSSDGEDWTMTTSGTVAMNRAIYVGLAAAACGTSVTESVAQFDEVSFEGDVSDAPAFRNDPADGIVVAEAGVGVGGSVFGRAMEVGAKRKFFSKTAGPEWLTIDETGALGGVPAPEDVGVQLFRVAVSSEPSMASISDEVVLRVYVISEGMKRLCVSPGGSGSGISWLDAAGDLHDAVTLANAIIKQRGREYCTLWVQEGEYELERPLKLSSHVRVCGGFTGTEEEWEDRVAPEDSLTVLRRVLADDSGIKGGGVITAKKAVGFVLNGLTLRGGREKSKGGALTAIDSKGQIKNCVITDNQAKMGGGLYLEKGRYTLTNRRVENNKAQKGGGIFLSKGAKVRFGQGVVSGNIALESGGGLYAEPATRFDTWQSSFTDNQAVRLGGGAAFQRGARGIFTNSMISRNAAGESGGGVDLFRSAQVLLRGCVLSENKITGPAEKEYRMALGSDGGGAVRADGQHGYKPQLRVINCTIVGNDSGHAGGGAFLITQNNNEKKVGGTYVFLNNIIIGSKSAEAISWDGFGTLDLASNLFFENARGAFRSLEETVSDENIATLGETNINTDPLFVNMAMGDYHLRWNSPAVDRGENDVEKMQPRDFEKRPRVIDGDGDETATVDMGAFELQRPLTSWDVSDAVVAHWKMNDNAQDNIVSDATGRYDGAFLGEGASSEATSLHAIRGVSAGALEFDGVDDLVDYGTTIGAVLASDFSVTGWFRTDDLRTSYSAVFSKRNASDPFQGLSVYVQYDPASESDGQLVVWAGLGKDSDIMLTGDTFVADDQWHHFVAQRTSLTVELFIDGALEDKSESRDGGANMTNRSSGYLGYDPYAATNWRGALDDMRVLNRPLNAAEIAGIYNNGEGSELTANSVPYFKEDPIWLGYIDKAKVYSFDISDLIYDADADENLTVFLADGPLWLSLTEAGALSGQPDAQISGMNTWTAEVHDGKGGIGRATLYCEVVENDAPFFPVDPILVKDAASGWPYRETISDTAIDSDIPSGDSLTFAKLSGPAWLSLDKTGLLEGTPSSADLGENTFTISATDRTGATAQATLTLNVADTLSVQSATSPAWVEHAVESSFTTIAISVDGGPTFDAVRENPTLFYADNAMSQGRSSGILLSPTRATDLTLTASRFDNHTSATVQTSLSEALTWTATDLTGKTSATRIFIRTGDSLLLTAKVRAGKHLEIDFNGNGVIDSSGRSGDQFETLYNTPGIYVSSATIDGILVGQIAVIALGVSLETPIACEERYRREKEVSVTPAAHSTSVIWRSADPSQLEVALKEDLGATTTLHLRPYHNNTSLLQARLGGSTGPILQTTPVQGFALDSAYPSYVLLIEVLPDGTRIVEHGVVMNPVVPEVDFHLHIFTSGATFEDSTLDNFITSEDLDEEGTYMYRIIKAPNTQSNCHWLNVYQNNKTIGNL